MAAGGGGHLLPRWCQPLVQPPPISKSFSLCSGHCTLCPQRLFNQVLHLHGFWGVRVIVPVLQVCFQEFVVRFNIF